MVKIVTDSTSDITRDLALSLGVTVVPLTVFFGKESFLDRVEMSTDEFYKRLVGDVFPTTTQPSPGVFAEVYNQLAQETNEIVVIVISGRLSGTYQSALHATSMIKKKGIKVEVIDSRNVAMSLGLLVIDAANKAKSGASFDDVVSSVKNNIPRVHPYMYFDTLKYLAKGGRVGKAQGLVGSILSIKPIVTLDDGEVSPVARVRSKKAGLDHLYKFVQGYGDNIQGLAVEYANTSEDADLLIERLAELYPKEKIIRSVVSPVLGTYMGPNVVGVFVLEGDKKP
ncbi:MAG: DegV family protein [Dehalococcoidales bacterium]|jgi:DegV family protein with EDD domain|nr:DegV family protein [Dehalococcoidales bacterium]MDD4322090.1 DegV family protein [Dehalococcoidales bacterium]MDD4793661.1 DegV family protein [Dehalococcoidales bacterium]MDD5122164.1 DegV family protein [Dehalococcoidales bacterium]MDD5497856.1 DegV family protein [Dehalococcoidales bacterium]